MKNLVVLFAVALGITLTGCGGSGSPSSSSSKTTPTTPITPTLSTISVQAGASSLFAGQTTQLKSMGTYSDGSSQDLTSQVSWSSTNQNVASVSTSGLVKAIAAGQATITATSGTKSGTVAISVNAVVLSSIVVTPANVSVATGESQQFAASGIFSDGSTTDITKSVLWATDSSSVATITQTGLATGTGAGVTNVTATSGTVVGSMPLNVTAAVLQSIDISPDGATVPAGGQVQYSVTGTFSDNTSQNLTNATFSSSAPSVATVDPVTGVATGVAASATPVTITATLGSFTDTTTLTVTAATLQLVSVTPASASIAKGTTEQFSASGTFSDGSIQPLLEGVTWSSLNSAVAGVDVNGIAMGSAVGQTTIQAEYGGISGSAALTVTPAVLASITVTPALPTVGIGGTEQFTATGVYNDGSTQDLTSLVQWVSSNADVALISNTGMANALSTGTAQIVAEYQNLSGSATLTVSVAKLTSITVMPANPIVPTRTKFQFTAAGVFSDGSTAPLTGVSWSGSWGKITKINGQGLAQTKKAGTVKITARLNGMSGTTTMTVTSSGLSSVAITPVAPTIASGTTQQFTLTGTFGGGATVDLSRSAYWQSNNYKEAVVNNAGLATGMAPGEVTITATYTNSNNTYCAQTTLTLSSASIASVAVNPPDPTVVPGSVQLFTATGTFSDGTSQDVTALAQWSSSNPSVAVVSSTGVASSATNGTTTIKATFKAEAGSTVLTVN